MVGPNCRTQRHVRGISSANSRNYPICLREVETRVEAQSHYRCGGLGRSHARHHAKHSVLVKPDVMIASGQRNYLVEVLAFNPQLILTRIIASVFAPFEHGDDYDLDLDRRRRLSAL